MPPTKNHAKNPKAGPLEDVLCWNCDQKLQHKALTDHHNRFKGDANHAGKKKAYYKPDVKKMTFFQASAKTEEKKKEAKKKEGKREAKKKEEMREEKKNER